MHFSCCVSIATAWKSVAGKACMSHFVINSLYCLFSVFPQSDSKIIQQRQRLRGEGKREMEVRNPHKKIAREKSTEELFARFDNGKWKKLPKKEIRQ